MTTRAATLARAADLCASFEAAGAQRIDAPILQPADALLDLYGEEIRARAYVTSDALRGEQMLRPDFTVPVVQMHMAHGAEPARYTYAGEVFRRQEHDPSRANEYFQVGYEVFDRENPAAADAEVFCLFETVLSPLGLRAATGDIGILTAAVRGLRTTEARKSALLRHIWRPRRFRSLLDRYAGRIKPSKQRLELLAGHTAVPDAPLIGKRSQSEIDARIALLHADAATAPLSETEVDLLDALVNVRETMPFALQQLRDLAVDMPSIEQAVARLSDRAEALAKRGVDVDALPFEASYGRTSMEYYDGFVFGYYHPKRHDLPAVATGGRYDALTRRLGGGAEIPAVGGVIRPDLMLMLEGGT
ncbi:ATP phosphoribosyltransferase regulatory subunit [Roseobacter litoralis]|uniref:Histidine--tRNA ligase n=1 Tax=Roseobacter litoralis (strain ATCC 49566 / DSM 6996 / JCM 21268 / NBRC 15278 / OCh 149) TaxID=391595 RepID=F7ZHM7_ROSLO|nr:ATP phosphoribosyltransferase regulatory subunit [Roseobacter litoralis]AEI92438.1 ATP phosphoribosyltransferase regulatory subunit HisZ [Roseobacter litoralis Och 149]